MRLIIIGMSTPCCLMLPSNPLAVSRSLSKSGKWDLMHSFQSTALILQDTNYELKHHKTRNISYFNTVTSHIGNNVANHMMENDMTVLQCQTYEKGLAEQSYAINFYKFKPFPKWCWRMKLMCWDENCINNKFFHLGLVENINSIWLYLASFRFQHEGTKVLKEASHDGDS